MRWGDAHLHVADRHQYRMESAALTRSSTIELTVHIRPRFGWLACRIHTNHVIDGFREDFEIWDSTGALVAQSRQLALIP
ncbi:hypothetical protein ACFQZZ_00525 [Nocardia sp. GCM10030253]|uniref:hypothetical protein n=1 Tax=Nocardia sp. GCM10030253 TaxID=3273404 RepID=UPI003629D2EF